MNKTVLDELLSHHPIRCHPKPVIVAPEDIVHVVGAQEPVREQPDDRARMLLNAGWLKVSSIRFELTETERAELVVALQHEARTWLKTTGATASPATREQIRWVIEKTRSHESKQQIVQRIWMAATLHGLGNTGLAFDQEGQIFWDGGLASRIGLSPDDVLDVAWSQPDRQTYTASFRQANGMITRGKGRHRWNIYQLTIDPAAKFLFDRRVQQVEESVALIVASEVFATQPQLPRDFYGDNAFQQACIDAQDQPFSHILVLSPEHGIVSLDDTVSSDKPWDEVLKQGVWPWQVNTVQRLGAYLFGNKPAPKLERREASWWAWLNPDSQYLLTVFGSGFAVRILIDHLVRSKIRSPQNWPKITLSEQRPGYDAGDIDDAFELDLGSDLDEEFESDLDYDDDTHIDIEKMLDLAAEFASLVNVFVPPTGEMWEIASDEALIPIRLLTETGINIEDLLDLVTDMVVLLGQSLPISMLINAPMLVSVLLQITHSLVHDENEAIMELVDTFPEGVLRQYIEKALQEPSQEDRLCACLTLAEQAQLLSISITPAIREQILVWLQTYLSTRLRQRILGELDQ
ncbi:MAG: hypothetical protein JW966_13885 [Anaerolineae bacterium]|nr:hypothetical protein [Anaerolineae bacterium]